MTTHEAGWAHAAGALDGPSWLRLPEDVNALHPLLWSGTARRTDDGGVEVGGVDLRDLLAEHNSPAYVLDEADFRQRAKAFRDAFKDYDVFYAGKAFLCTAVARWVQEEGLNLDVCSSGELTVALRAGVDPKRIGYHGNNKTYAELRRAVARGVGRIIVDSFQEIERLVEIVRERGLETALAQPPRPTKCSVMIRVTAGVEAHTHEYIATAHEDQKFGFSITNGDAWRAVQAVQDGRGAGAAGPALPHRQPDLRLLGLRGRGTTGARPAPPSLRGAGRHAARAGPGRRVRHRVHHPGRPQRPRAAGHRDDQDRRARVPRAGDPRAAPLHRARPRDRRPERVHRLHRRHRQAGRAGRRRDQDLRQRRRRDVRQHPDGAVRRGLLLHDRQPRAARRRPC